MKMPSIKKLHLELSTSRIQALTDGIFAIAMTILVLNLEVTDPGEKVAATLLHRELVGIWPHLMHYAESFLILAIFWVKHHQQFHFIKRTDSNLLWMNIFSLLFVCLIPFTTSLVSDYGDLHTAAMLFEVNLFMAGALYALQWRYATHNYRLVDKDLDKGVIKVYRYTSLVTPGVSLLAIFISIFYPRLGTMTYILIPFIFIFFRRK